MTRESWLCKKQRFANQSPGFWGPGIRVLSELGGTNGSESPSMSALSARKGAPLLPSLVLGVLGNFDILSRISGKILKLALVCKDILAACMKARLGVCGNLTPCTFFARGTVRNALAAAAKPLWMHEMVTRIVCEEHPTEAPEYVAFVGALRVAFPTAKTLSLNAYHEISMAEFRQWTDDYTALTSLTLYDHHVGTGHEDHNRDELDFTPYDNLRKYTALTSLAIYGGNIADALGFFHSMRCMTSLVVLNLHDNNLSRMNRSIHTALPLLTRLKHLSLTDGRVMDNPGLVYALRHMDLQTLDLSGTDLCGRDAPLGRALRKNTGLESLNLAYCDMSTPVRVIRELTSLTHLDLRSIAYTDLLLSRTVDLILQAVANFPFKEPRHLHLLMGDDSDDDNDPGSVHNPVVMEDE